MEKSLRRTVGRCDLTGLVENLATTGYAVSDEAIDWEMSTALFGTVIALESGAFSPAGVGRELDHGLNPFVRGDEIHWVGRRTEGVAGYLAWMEGLRLAVNRELYLGLFEYECHFTRYPVGRFYRRHLDAFRGETNRVLSTVLYLNPQWQPDDGGELVLYVPDATTELAAIQPRLGRLVIFLSDAVPHEVLPTRRVRYSLTGWFRVNQSTAGRVDPGCATLAATRS